MLEAACLLFANISGLTPIDFLSPIASKAMWLSLLNEPITLLSDQGFVS